MANKDLFEKLWGYYTQLNPTVQKIHDTFTKLGENVLNDHIALRTFNDSRVNIKMLEKPFLEAGFKEVGTYSFEEKKLKAKHYELPNNAETPRVFISELLIEEFSSDLQNTITNLLDSVKNELYKANDLIFRGNIWGTPSYETYHKLRKESEYAAWLYVYGFIANHFTVSINHLKKLQTIEEVNEHLKNNGFKLNTSGGEIKGTKQDLLQQSSTLADNITVSFIEGNYEIPSCYYEFAVRYPDKDGNIFSGFLAKSADKIFESTNYHN